MNLLETKNLTLSIANKILCNNLNLQIKPKEVWGILGRNGSGKTTLLHTLANLHPHFDGEIYLHTKKLCAIPLKQRARLLGILFQDFSTVFPQSVWEYCRVARYPHTSEDPHIVRQALLAMKLENHVSQKVHTLSGGERQRLAIATLLAQTPKIYLLDEPTNHLDIHHQIHVMNHFKRLAQTQDVSIMMALHDVNMANHYCDKILMLFGDGNYLQGTPEAICTAENLQRLYRYPLRAVSTDRKFLWFPEFQNDPQEREILKWISLVSDHKG